VSRAILSWAPSRVQRDRAAWRLARRASAATREDKQAIRGARAKAHVTPHPIAAPAVIAEKPLALRAQAFATTAAGLLSADRSGNINNTNNRREVGPLQASTTGPLHVATPSVVQAATSSAARACVR
jgi:hypothetical protein